MATGRIVLTNDPADMSSLGITGERPKKHGALKRPKADCPDESAQRLLFPSAFACSEKKKCQRRGDACGGNVCREGGFRDDSGSSAQPGASVCDMCKSAALPRLLGPDWDGRSAHVAAVLRHGSKFVSDYRTRPGILAEPAPPSEAHLAFFFFFSFVKSTPP